ncbi:Efflux pump antibiotic resistance protein [Neofusicoccum parvum]|uniref:Efflux pump antibiotic resistance protein n=1 Tax=Neofusicoccum parvum TaxID=310453 RepID=A0ACB5RNF4_9PEZI|nr:Efflux pump antibiotic resistance protein [Neofusicoccum parvum]
MSDNSIAEKGHGCTAPCAIPSADVEKLGRQRPAIFTTRCAEFCFCFSLLASMFMAEYFISGFHIILPVLTTDLNIPPESQSWPASVFSLVTGAFILPFGRLADIYGGRILFICGLVWFTAWCLIAGFSQNYVMLILSRALAGLGPAAFLPSGIMLLGTVYRPGPRKNLVFSLYGAFSPVGFFTGIFFGGISGQLLEWGWYFWFGAILLSIVVLTSLFSIPVDRPDGKATDISMDWWGLVTIVPGLLLVVFAITDSSHAPQRWATPYIIVTFVIGVLCLCAAFYVEGWVADTPLLPFDLFEPKSMKPLIIGLFFSYGVFGIFLFYASFYVELVLGIGTLQTTAWFAPMAAGGLILATGGGLVLHLLPGKALIMLSACGNIVCTLLFAIMPEHPNYWAYVFPAMVCATMGVDIMFSVSNVFITTSMPRHRQGLAGALINTTLFLGMGFFLGVADLAVSSTAHLGLRKSYKVAFWLGVGCSGFALLMLLFVKIGRAKSDLTIEERKQLEEEAEAEGLR